MVTQPPANPPSAPPTPALLVQAAPQVGGRPGPLRSADLLGAQQAVEIEHNGLVYRLQSTRAGKLILTK
jgi:hemin uptake protein HemP